MEHGNETYITKTQPNGYSRGDFWIIGLSLLMVALVIFIVPEMYVQGYAFLCGAIMFAAGPLFNKVRTVEVYKDHFILRYPFFKKPKKVMLSEIVSWSLSHKPKTNIEEFFVITETGKYRFSQANYVNYEEIRDLITADKPKIGAWDFWRTGSVHDNARDLTLISIVALPLLLLTGSYGAVGIVLVPLLLVIMFYRGL